MSRVEDVLAAHLFTLYPGEIVCDCEWSDRDDKGTRAGDNRMIAAHCAHVATALAAAGIGDVAEAERRGAKAVLDAVEAGFTGPESVGAEATRFGLHGQRGGCPAAVARAYLGESA